jgi:cytochrome b pre-mRNA-processing protein 3
MDSPLSLFAGWHKWRRKTTGAQKLYGAIMAQTRLPVFYQAFGVPDTLDGRFVVLSLHLFAVLHRLRRDGTSQAVDLSQELIDIFTKDMETVLRETGVGDLSIPKKMRGLAAKSSNLLESYETSFVAGYQAFVAAIAGVLPLDDQAAEDAGKSLASYVKYVMEQLDAQRVSMMSAGKVEFPIITAESVELLRDRYGD